MPFASIGEMRRLAGMAEKLRGPKNYHATG